MPALRPRRWTIIDQVEQLIDQREGMSPRYELVDGELLSAAGAERAASANRSRSRSSVLQRFVSHERIGEIRLGPSRLALVLAGNDSSPTCTSSLAVDGRLRPDLQLATRG